MYIFTYIYTCVYVAVNMTGLAKMGLEHAIINIEKFIVLKLCILRMYLRKSLYLCKII